MLKFPILEQGIPLCSDHNESALNPHVLSTWVPEKVAGPTTKRLIYLESQVNTYFFIFSISFRLTRLFLLYFLILNLCTCQRSGAARSDQGT